METQQIKPSFYKDRRYYASDLYFKQQFGEKVYKLSLNGGMTCPNRDGTLGHRGCVFCSAGGSGDFTPSPYLSMNEQIQDAKERIAGKYKSKNYIAYFQSYTNTYAPIHYLQNLYSTVLSKLEIIGLSIATRPDCISDEILHLLSDLKVQYSKPIFIELGLQTIHKATSEFIRRGYPLSCYIETLHRLKECNIPVITHVILGLPGEGYQQMLETVRFLSRLPIDGIKLQLLHIIDGTDLADYYHISPFPLLTMEQYTDLLVSCLEYLPPTTVVHRLTGDGPKHLNPLPIWSQNKKQVLNMVHHKMKLKNTWQSRLWNTAGTERIDYS